MSIWIVKRYTHPAKTQQSHSGRCPQEEEAEGEQGEEQTKQEPSLSPTSCLYTEREAAVMGHTRRQLSSAVLADHELLTSCSPCWPGLLSQQNQHRCAVYPHPEREAPAKGDLEDCKFGLQILQP